MKKFIFYFMLVSTVSFSQLLNVNFGSPYWIDMDIINKIKLGEKYSSLVNTIGYPPQIEEIKKMGKDIVSTYKYRIKENGYDWRLFLKPDHLDREVSTLEDSYFLILTFNNDMLTSIKRESTIGEGIKYFDPTSFKASDLLLGIKKPFWIDMEDINLISVGMNEDEVVKIIGNPSQFISLFKNGKNNTKKVFYRLREKYSTELTGSSFIYKIPDANENFIRTVNGEKIDCEIGNISLIPFKSFNFVSLKKGGEINFKKGTLSSGGPNMMFIDADGNNQSISKKKIFLWVENGEINTITKSNLISTVEPGNYVFYKDKNGKQNKIDATDIKSVTLKGYKMKIDDGEFKSFKASMWSSKSYNVEFQYDNQILTQIKRIKAQKSDNQPDLLITN